MNISMIVLNPFTHDVRVWKEAKTLVQAGHTVTVNALWAEGLAVDETLKDIHVHRVRIHTRERRHLPFETWFELIPAFVSAVVAQRPDVIHAHDLNALIPAARAANRRRVPYIYDSHELQLDQDRQKTDLTAVKLALWRIIERRLARRALAVITVSNSIADVMAQTLGIPRPVVIMNCPPLASLPSRGSLRSWLDIPPGQFIVFYQGIVKAGRGLETTLRAVSQVPDTVFVVLGDGPFIPHLAKLASELNVENRLYMPGKVSMSSLPAYTGDANLGVALIENISQSYFYSLPNKLFDYLMYGVPALASRFPDMSQVIETSGAGFALDPADVEGVARVIRQLVVNPALQAELAANARKAAEDYYNWDLESRKLLQIYAKIA